MVRSRSARRTILGGAVVGLLAAGGTAAVLPLGASAATAPRRAEVAIKDFRFTARTVTIARGGTVTWRFQDSARHNVRSVGSRSFRSSPTKATGTYTVRFRRAGTYRYDCSLHPSLMTGRVIVR